ncbi:MAG: FliM/FliN family flagellar motor switch protein [Acidimicrobiales bacterium]
MTLADTAPPEGDPSGNAQPTHDETAQFPGPPPALQTGVDDQIDLGRRTAVREAQFRSVTVEVSVWIGKTRRTFGDLAKLRPGDVIELDRAVGAPVDIVLNREVVIARGEVVDVGDEYGVRITEIVSDEDG